MTCLVPKDWLACACTTGMSLFAELRVGIITQPPLVFENNVHHKVTLILCCSNVQHHGMQRPLPSQNIHKLMVHNQLGLLLVVDM